jgi:lantibiotic modifying enzyme
VWTPLESNTIRGMATESISEITDELLSVPVHEIRAFDLCERALLYAYLALDYPGRGWQERSVECINTAIDALASSPTIANGLYGGLAGIGWLIEHISSLLFPPRNRGAAICDDEDVISEVDKRLMEQFVRAPTSDQNYDLISGVVGIGIYWLERLPRDRAIHGIKQTLDFLDYTSQALATGVAWFTPPPLIPPLQKHLAPNGYYNLGVAHGVPGVIAFLAQAASLTEHDEMSRRASELLTASIDWLLMQRRPSGSLSRYSSWIIPGQEGGDSRLAWCYGDLGIAAILHFAGLRVRQESWKSEAINMAYECASRSTRAQVFDAPLCHGALGIAHIFHRFYNATSDEVFREATIDWTLRGMAFRQPNTGIAGYYAWDPNPNDHMRADASFLSGAVGIALCLLSIISSREPKWDRLMLLSGV